MTEDDFLKSVIDLAHVYGWKVAHFRPAKTERGWRTAVQADGAGFPDLVLVRDGVIFAEVKSENGKLSEAQKEWLQTLEKAHQNWFVWQPCNWDEIVEILKR